MCPYCFAMAGSARSNFFLSALKDRMREAGQTSSCSFLMLFVEWVLLAIRESKQKTKSPPSVSCSRLNIAHPFSFIESVSNYIP